MFGFGKTKSEGKPKMQELRDKFHPAEDTGPTDDLRQMLAELKKTQAKQTSAERRGFLQHSIDEIQALINSRTG